MEYEKKLIKLLNLDAIITPSKVIKLYDKEKLVGSIVEIEEDNEKYYLTTINYKSFKFKRKRNIKDTKLIYKFQFQDFDNRIFMEMNLGLNPYLTLYSELTGSMEFSINEKELNLNFKTNVTNGSILEHVNVRLDNKSDLHKYLGSYYSYKVEINDNFDRTKNMELISYVDNSYNKVLIITNCEGHETRSKVKGSIRDTIRLDKNGKDTLSRFRAYINKLFPFNMDFLKVFLEERGIRNDAFLELYPDLNKFKKYYAIREINSNTLLGIRLTNNYSTLKSYGDIISNLKDCYEFGYLKGTGDYSGYYTWNNDYVFKVSNNNEIESIFDINNKKIITNLEEIKKIYQSNKVLIK